MNPDPPPGPAPAPPPDKLTFAEAAGLFDMAWEAGDETGGGNETGDPPQPAGIERAGDEIDRYTLVRCLGVGGCGVVWLAEQTQPLRRQVALKIIKAGMDTREFIARFEQERQALALMEHPHIAKVFDAGATATGRPYFVMEYVPGEPLTAYCDSRKLDVLARLRLFRQVCLAIQHAHGKGVVHRDLKPSNILVRDQDGLPFPMVIDFGVAKAAAGSLTDKTLHTRIEQVIGTPGYMSPEQLDPQLGAADGRSDVYGLGAVLYELLTGAPPLDDEGFAQAAFAAVLRRVREEDPPPPSRRITSLAADLRATVAARRGTAVQYLSGILRGELDWLVMRCLEKDPRHRYQTASELAGDIELYLRDGSVLARPSPWSRKAWRFLRRRRVAATAAAVVTVALAVTAAAIIENRRTSAENHRLRFAARPLRHPRNFPPFVNSLGMAFQPVTLAFDSADDPAGLADLWLATCETRRSEFATFRHETGHDMSPPAGISPYYQPPQITWEHPGFEQTDDHPVVCVSWNDATAFCEWLTKKEQGKSIGPHDFYRLPTDREWSVAVALRFEYGDSPRERAAVAQAAFDERGDGFPWGSAWPPPPQCGNLAANGVAGYRDPYPYTAPVGSFPAGEFGLHDMVGNVLEWCLDPANTAKTRYQYMTVRGSSWGTCDRAELASANRLLGSPKAWRYPSIGFRCALVRHAAEKPKNLLENTTAADWRDLMGTWRITPERIAQSNGDPRVNPLLDPWLLWKKPGLPDDWLLEFQAAPDLPENQSWEICCKTLRIAYRFASQADYSAVTIGHGGVHIIREQPGGPSITLARFFGEPDPEMAIQPVSYAVEVRGDWVRVFRKGVLMLETQDKQRGIGSLAFDWLNVPGSLYGLRLRPR